MTSNQVLSALRHRIEVCWNMTEVFVENRDAHGCHDMGVEIQALQRAITEVDKLTAISSVEGKA